MNASSPARLPETQQRLDALSWYHTIDVAPGVTTKGWFDLREHVARYHLPERMDGMRALDIGTWDGFWAFEMEKRGAEVVALDVDHENEYDWPPRRRPPEPQALDRGQGFRLIKELKGSSVARAVCNIYEATPERLGGTFDVVFCGAVLLHLRDQLLALERCAGLCRGQLIFADEYDRASGFVPFPVSRYHADRDAAVVFWLPARKTWKRMIWTAGFEDVADKGSFTVTIRSPAGKRVRIPHVVFHARGTASPNP